MGVTLNRQTFVGVSTFSTSTVNFKRHRKHHMWKNKCVNTSRFGNTSLRGKKQHYGYDLSEPVFYILHYAAFDV